MPDGASKPSFTRGRRWSIGLNVAIIVLVVFAVVVMANYLSTRHYERFYLSSNTRIELSPRTLSLLHALTNRVAVTVYYDQEDPFYSDITDLLNAYSAVNHRIEISSVDYYRQPGAAAEIKSKYQRYIGSTTNENCVIFDCGGRVKVVDGDALVQYTLEQVPDPTQRVFRRKPVLFSGEMAFTSALLAVSNPKPLQACYLTGHDEPSLTDRSDLGYSTFADVLRQNYVQVQPLSLLGTNTVPADCDLLIDAGPTKALLPVELGKIADYLKRGGRFLALFNARSVNVDTGLENVLTNWDVKVWPDIAVDPNHMANQNEVVISAFAPQTVVNPIIGSGLCMILPRPVGALANPNAKSDPDAPKSAEAIAFTGAHAYLARDTARTPQRLPVMAIVDKKAPNGVLSGGDTRILVAGDSYFLDNNQIGQLSNRDFLNSAVNWLLHRSLLLEGVGPQPVTEFNLVMTREQLQAAEWIVLGAMPGGVLVLGGLVWLRRRR